LFHNVVVGRNGFAEGGGRLAGWIAGGWSILSGRRA
jgi:hypothetical protein